MAFCFLSSRLPSLRRIIYGKRLLEKEGAGQKQSINSFNEKDRTSMGRGMQRLHSADVLVEPRLTRGFLRSFKGRMTQWGLPALGKLPRKELGRSLKGKLCNTIQVYRTRSSSPPGTLGSNWNPWPALSRTPSLTLRYEMDSTNFIYLFILKQPMFSPKAFLPGDAEKGSVFCIQSSQLPSWRCTVGSHLTSGGRSPGEYGKGAPS